MNNLLLKLYRYWPNPIPYIDLENATSWFIYNGMKPNPDKYQAMVLGNKEDELNFK